MTFELQMLALAGILQMVLITIQAVLLPGSQGFAYGLGSRDEPKPESVLQGRARRTLANHMEGLAIAVPLILVAHSADISTVLTVWGAGLYLVARLIYVPLYMLGIPVLRTIAFNVGAAGLMLIAYELVVNML